jgi:predicted RNase H-like HicB family nuclease
MNEIIFLVEECAEGGYIAKGLSSSIITQADTIEELRSMVKDAVHCHYDDATMMPNQIPHIIYELAK